MIIAKNFLVDFVKKMSKFPMKKAKKLPKPLPFPPLILFPDPEKGPYVFTKTQLEIYQKLLKEANESK